MAGEAAAAGLPDESFDAILPSQRPSAPERDDSLIRLPSAVLPSKLDRENNFGETPSQRSEDWDGDRDDGAHDLELAPKHAPPVAGEKPVKLLEDWLDRASQVHREHMQRLQQRLLDDWATPQGLSGSIAPLAPAGQPPALLVPSPSSHLGEAASSSHLAVTPSTKPKSKGWACLSEAVSDGHCVGPAFGATPSTVSKTSANKRGAKSAIQALVRLNATIAGKRESRRSATSSGLSRQGTATSDTFCLKSPAVSNVQFFKRSCIAESSHTRSCIAESSHTKSEISERPSQTTSNEDGPQNSDSDTTLSKMSKMKSKIIGSKKQITSLFALPDDQEFLQDFELHEQRVMRSWIGKYLFSQAGYFFKLIVAIANVVFVYMESDARIKERLADGDVHRSQRYSFWGEVICYSLFWVDTASVLFLFICYSCAGCRDFLRSILFDSTNFSLFSWYIAITALLLCSTSYFAWDSGPNVSFLRIVPIFLNTRLSRTAWLKNRAERIGTILWICVRSCPYLVITLAAFTAFIVNFAVLLSFLICQWLEDQDQVPENLTQFYGSLITTSRSLFMAVSGGDDWTNIMAPLVTLDPSGVLPNLFVGYIAFMVVGLLNIITGLFVDHAMQLASKSREMKVREKIECENELARELKKIFIQGDTSHTDTLSWEEFRTLLLNDSVNVYLSTLDLHFSELHTLYQILDTSGKGTVGIDDFVWGCMRLKGEAKSMDLCTLLYEHRQFKLFACEALDGLQEMLLQLSTSMAATSSVTLGPSLGHVSPPAGSCVKLSVDIP